MKMFSQKFTKKPGDPYRLFFPAGFLFGLLGTGIWIAFWLHIFRAYPGSLHGEIMIGGFLFTVAAGFLMTAVPKFTGALPATVAEKFSFFFLVAGLFFASLSFHRIWFHLFLLSEIVLLIRFALRRFLGARFKPGPPFVLVGFGIFSLLFSVLFLILNDLNFISVSFLFFARQLFLYGFFFYIVLGIGTQLIPSILGTRPAMKTVSAPQTPFNQTQKNGKKIALFFFYGVLLLASFIAEAWFNPSWAKFARAFLISGIFLFHWRIFLKPKPPGILNLCLWISAWMLAIGVWIIPLFPNYAVHGAHIIFIGSLSLMIFSITTRVTLAHGGHARNMEQRSFYLTALLCFLLLALATRIASPFSENYYSHLAYAAILWIAALTCWLIPLFGKLK